MAGGLTCTPATRQVLRERTMPAPTGRAHTASTPRAHGCARAGGHDGRHGHTLGPHPPAASPRGTSFADRVGLCPCLHPLCAGPGALTPRTQEGRHRMRNPAAEGTSRVICGRGRVFTEPPTLRLRSGARRAGGTRGSRAGPYRDHGLDLHAGVLDHGVALVQRHQPPVQVQEGVFLVVLSFEHRVG